METEAAMVDNDTAGTAVEVDIKGPADAAVVVIVKAEAAEEAWEDKDSVAETAGSEVEVEFLLSFAWCSAAQTRSRSLRMDDLNLGLKC